MRRSSLSGPLWAASGLLMLACSVASLPGPAASPVAPDASPVSFEPTGRPDEPTSQMDLENENLLAGLPDGFEVGYQAQEGNQSITEMIPASETVDAWTTMVTVQIYRGETNTTPQQAQDSLTQAWFNACQNSEAYPVADGSENGYNFILWQLYCPVNPATQKVEYTYMKAMQGNDSFYLVQVAFQYEPTEADVTRWMQYLKEVKVCDSRLAQPACP